MTVTNSCYEVERKWVLSIRPEICQTIKPIDIVQAYLEGVRIRKAGDKYYITVKSHGDIARLEWEQETPKWVFEQLIAGADKIIQKQRFVVENTEPIVVVDVFGGSLSGLVLLEAEWLAGTNIESITLMASNYELPHWIKGAIEVTSDARFNNASLALCQTIPSFGG